MTPHEILLAIDAVLTLADRLYDLGQKLSGDQPWPEWEEVLERNASLQKRIEEAKQ